MHVRWMGLILALELLLSGCAAQPEPAPEPEPTAQEDNDAMLVDHEYRLTLVELGVTSDAV